MILLDLLNELFQAVFTYFADWLIDLVLYALGS